MSLDFRSDYLSDPASFDAFNTLAGATFGLDFAPWNRSGAPDGQYRPYSFFDGSRCVSNVSATRMTFRHCGRTLNALQLGTVMTDPAYRGQGLASQLIQRALDDRSEPFAFLFTGENNHPFYQGNGFSLHPELHAFATDEMRGKEYAFQRLDLSKTADLGIFWKYLRAAVPQGDHMSPRGLRALEEFYLFGAYRKSAYYFPNCSAVLILEKSGNDLFLVEQFATREHDAAWFARRAWSVFPDVKKLEFGFWPEKGSEGLRKETVTGSLMTRGDVPAEPLLIPVLARA